MNKEVNNTSTTSIEPTTVAKIVKVAKEAIKYIKELFSFRKLRKYILQKKIEAKQKEVAKALAEGRIEDAGYLQAEVRKLYEEFSLFEEIKDAIKTKLDKDKLKAGLEYLEICDDTTKDNADISISSVEAPKCTEWSPSKPKQTKPAKPTKPAVSESDRAKTLKVLLSNNLGSNSYKYTEKDIAIIRKGLEIRKRREAFMNSKTTKTVKTIILATIGSGIIALSGCKTYQPDYKTPEDIGERVKIVKPGDTVLIPDLTQPAKTWYLVDDIGLSTWLGIPEDFIHNK
jgi:hypothetical protein